VQGKIFERIGINVFTVMILLLFSHLQVTKLEVDRTEVKMARALTARIAGMIFFMVRLCTLVAAGILGMVATAGFKAGYALLLCDLPSFYHGITAKDHQAEEKYVGTNFHEHVNITNLLSGKFKT